MTRALRSWAIAAVALLGCSSGGAGSPCTSSSNCGLALFCAPDSSGQQVCTRACGQMVGWRACGLGLRCDFSLTWAPHFVLPADSGVCVPAGTAVEGEHCRSGDDCVDGLACATSAWDDTTLCRASCGRGRPCPASEVCSPDGHVCHAPCVASSAQPCSDFAVCENGVCISFGEAGACANGTPCASGQVCVSNSCMSPTAVPPGTGALGDPCFADWDCANPLGCRRLTTESGVCSERCGPGPCPTGQVCQDGLFCTPPCQASTCTAGACVEGICFNVADVQYCPSGMMCEEPTAVCRDDHCYAPGNVP